MVERFLTDTGTISVATGASVVLGTGTLFGGRDRASARVIAFPSAEAAGPSWRRVKMVERPVPIYVGTVAEVDPRGVYDNLQLPLKKPYRGPRLVDVDYELVDGLALVSGATPTAVFARFAAFLEQNMGLVGNMADSIDFSLVPNNTLFVDAVTRTLYQWRNGVLEVVYVIGAQWTPRGLWDSATTYAKNDLIQAGNFVFVSNINGNLNLLPDYTTPVSTVDWTLVPLPTVEQVLTALGVHQITISTDLPSGGVNGDLWFRVA